MGTLQLHGRKALVTGAGTRLGARIATALAEQGCDVLVHYGSSRAGAEAVAEAARQLGRSADTVGADLYQRDQVLALAHRARAWCGGKLDLLVHNAANFDRVEPEQMTPEHWDRAMALNATAPYVLTTALAPELRAARGAVIAIGCISAQRPWKNYIPYSVSKAALVHLVKALALGLAPEVRVNAVSPGTVLPPEDYDETRLAAIRANIPLGRVGEPDDIVRAVLFFAQNDFVTGQNLAVDGGRSIG